jgi:hypothetical protein
MANVLGYVTVYESSDGGSGDPNATFWQFFVDPGNAPRQAVTTKNFRLAKTMALAIKTSSRVSVTYGAKNEMEQVRIEFNYICELEQIRPCSSSPEPQNVCLTRRYAPCTPDEIPPRP